MEFVKYHDIENDYRQKFIGKFDYLNMYDKRYALLEKLDGSCFQIKLTSYEDPMFGRRKAFLKPDEKFYDWQSAVKKLDLSEIQEKINLYSVEEKLETDDIIVTLFGELCGKGIQKRVNYGDEKYISFYDVYIDDPIDPGFLPFLEMKKFLKNQNLPMVPVIAENLTLEEALNFKVDGMNSKVLNIEDNEAEGVVIRLMSDEIFNYHNERFILKRKATNFKEKAHKSRKPKKTDSVVIIWKTIVESYINDNRLKSIFSKEGEIDTPKDIGKYMKLMLVDVKLDFNKDYPEFNENVKDNKQIRQIFNISKKVVPLLNKYL